MISICKECGFKYKEEYLAKKCEDYCKKYNACNTELIGKVIKWK